jgi:hypothetical protein
MLTPPTDRLHKFLAISGIALFIVGVTFSIDKYDQAVRQFIEAKHKVMELSKLQQKLSNLLADGKPDAIEAARISAEIESTSSVAEKALDIAHHATVIRSLWFTIGTFCVLVGLLLSVVGFRIWWSQPADQR